jgi:hypothetical protein
VNVFIEHLLDGSNCKRINFNKTMKFIFSFTKKSSVHNFGSYLPNSDVIVLVDTQQKDVDWLVIRLE